MKEKKVLFQYILYWIMTLFLAMVSCFLISGFVNYTFTNVNAAFTIGLVAGITSTSALYTGIWLLVYVFKWLWYKYKRKQTISFVNVLQDKKPQEGEMNV